MPPTQPPVRGTPPKGDARYRLWTEVKAALMILPAYFTTEIRMTGLRATDIFTLNATLGATIEDQVVTTLNRMRSVWDPGNDFPLHQFIRQPQTFPDVLLMRRTETGRDVALGVELKGWYLLAKEGEPSFRFQVTASACSEWDLMAVVPWYLSDVISGSPRVMTPFIEQAKFAAESRNYHWQHVRQTTANKRITSPPDVGPYPRNSDHILDRSASDGGGNFGRIARSGLMDPFISAAKEELIAGIEARYWRQFFNLFQERADPDRVERELQLMATRIKQAAAGADEDQSRQLLAQLTALLTPE